MISLTSSRVSLSVQWEPIRPAPPITTSFLPFNSIGNSLIQACANTLHELVALAGVRAGCGGAAVQWQFELLTVAAHPANVPRGHARHQRVVGYVTVDHGPCANEGVRTDRRATDNGAIRAQGRAAPHERVAIFILAADRGARIVDIGEDHAGSAEDIVFQGDVFVNGNVVLHLDVVTDDDPVADEHVLAE